MFIFVKKVDGRWKIAVATMTKLKIIKSIGQVMNFLELPLDKKCREAFIVAARMYHSLKEDGVVGIIPLEDTGE